MAMEDAASSSTADNEVATAPGPGERPVPPWGVTLVLIAGLLFTFVLLILLISLWPHPTPAMVPSDQPAVAASPPAGPVTPSDTTGAQASGDTGVARAASEETSAAEAVGVLWCTHPQGVTDSVRAARIANRWRPLPDTFAVGCATLPYFGDFPIWDEQRLLLLVLIAGALGGTVHGLRSFVWYVGNRELRLSWLPLYLSFPFAGAILSWIFYVVIRGGFFAPTTSVEETSPFGFVAVGALVGLFSTSAVLKLKEIAETVFTKPPSGRNAVPQSRETQAEVEEEEEAAGAPAVIERVERLSRAEGADRDAFVLRGSGFAQDSTVEVNGAPRDATFVSEAEMQVALATEDLQALAAGGELVVVVVSAAGARSEPVNAAQT